MPDKVSAAEQAIRDFEARLAASAAQQHYAPPQIAGPGPVISESTAPKWLHPFAVFIGPHFSRWIVRNQTLAAVIGIILVILAFYEVVGLPIGLNTQQVIINQSKIEQAKAEACSARSKAILDTVPMNQVAEAYAELTKECGPQQAAPTETPTPLTPLQRGAQQDAIIKEALQNLRLALRKEELAEINALQAAEDAGDYPKALLLSEQRVMKIEQREVNMTGKAGPQTGDALNHVAWNALFTRDFNKALTANTRALQLGPTTLVLMANHAHALMFLNRTNEAKMIYIANKGQDLEGKNHKTWEQAIIADFKLFHKAGLTRPLMAEIEADFSAP